MKIRSLIKNIEDDTIRWKDKFIDWKDVVKLIKKKIDQTIQGKLQIQCNLYQKTKGVFRRARTSNSKICTEAKRLLIAKEILRKKNRVEGSCSLTSDHTVDTKLRKLKQCATGTNHKDQWDRRVQK